MKALPMDLVPEVNSFGSELATKYKLPEDQFNIGVDLIVYKDGRRLGVMKDGKILCSLDSWDPVDHPSYT